MGDARFDGGPSASAQCGIKKNSAKAEALGRSAGGLSTKIHTLCDARGNPTAFHLTGGNCSDLEGADALIPTLGPVTKALLADKAYDAQDRVIAPLQARGCEVVIPSKANRLHPRPFDRLRYRARHLIENAFAKLKQFRAIATRYDKSAQNFLGAIYLASALIWLN